MRIAMQTASTCDALSYLATRSSTLNDPEILSKQPGPLLRNQLKIVGQALTLCGGQCTEKGVLLRPGMMLRGKIFHFRFQSNDRVDA